MTYYELISRLKSYLPAELAEDIVSQFSKIKQDTSTGTFERSAPGKFVETLVQILQHLSKGTYSASFKAGDIDDFLKNTEARTVDLTPDLKTNVTRIARGMYSLRSKRGIVHKGTVDPNIYDLRYICASAQWILTELIRYLFSTDVNTAGQLVEFIQVPIIPLVENFGERRLVLKECTTSDELLVLLLSYYPEYVPISQVYKDMDRRPKSTVANMIKSLHMKKLIERNAKLGCKLTLIGFQKANEIIKNSL